jgi:hypothetical protein
MEFSLTLEEKLLTYKQTKKSFEKDLIQRLCAIGKDPESFDVDNFIPEEDKMSEFYIKELILKIKKVEEKIKELSNLIN